MALLVVRPINRQLAVHRISPQKLRRLAAVRISRKKNRQLAVQPTNLLKSLPLVALPAVPATSNPFYPQNRSRR